MRRAYAIVVCLLLWGAEPVTFAQIGGPYPGGPYPGGGGRYPGGGYPPGTYPPGGGGGIPFPRRGKKSKTDSKEAPVPSKEFEGILRKLDEKQIVLEPSDTRIITIKRDKKTKFVKDGEDMKPTAIHPGDHLRVSASEDEQGNYYAIEVNFDKAGTAEERAAASQPVQTIQTGDDDQPAAAARRSGVSANEAGGAGDDDPDRPVLRRKDPAPAEVAKSEPPAPAAAPAPPAAAPTPAPAPARPAAKSAPEASPDAVPTMDSILKGSAPPPAASDPDDPGPPKLKYGRPARKSTPDHVPTDDSGQPVQVASAAPAPTGPGPIANPSEPLETRPAPRPAPAASMPRQDPVIEKARDKAGEFSDTLPDYICQEFMARFYNTAHVVSWQAQDVVSTEVIYEKGRERYRNVTVNGKPKKSIEESGGAWSTGEFASVLLDLFSPATAASFRYRRESSTAGKTSLVYDFDVMQPNSHWNVMAGSQSYRPAYRGTVWIDKRTYRALRIEMQAHHFPADFPLDKVESATDYDYVRFGGVEQFLLPVHAETLSCQTGTNQCAMNKIDFRNYHKYTGESTITFGPDTPDAAKPPAKK